MKSKYKIIENGFSNYDLSKNGNIIAMHISKYMANNIKKALEQYKPIRRVVDQHCSDCINGSKGSNEISCKDCTYDWEKQRFSHFQRKSKQSKN